MTVNAIYVLAVLAATFIALMIHYEYKNKYGKK